MQVAFALYRGFTALDVIGPFQVLADTPGHDAVLVAAEAGPVVDHTGRAPLVAAKAFSEVPAPDIIIVPGGRTGVLDNRLVEWIRAVHPATTWTTSVCTGSIYLATAGLLDGVDATTHWAWAERLNELGAHYLADRVVERGKIITAAGVSSGIDMALVLLDRLYGPVVAQSAQLAIEYDPQPPFDAGSPAKAPAAITDLVRPRLSPTSEWANTLPDD
jgi:transcriptional regulator GlxA family with amidase domain